MPKSDAFIRIQDQVLAVTAAIPRGRVATLAAIGEFLDVMPRHVAYILSRCDDGTRDGLPWHRVVANDGTLPRTRPDGLGRTQAELLTKERHVIHEGRLVLTPGRTFRPTTSNTGVRPVRRDSPEAGAQQRRTRRRPRKPAG